MINLIIWLTYIHSWNDLPHQGYHSQRSMHDQLWICGSAAYPSHCRTDNIYISTLHLFANSFACPTCPMTQPNRSGLWLAQAPTSRPPFEPPWITSLMEKIIITFHQFSLWLFYFFDLVYPVLMRNSAAHWKSSKTFCLLKCLPLSCHFSPYSLIVVIKMKNEASKNALS